MTKWETYNVFIECLQKKGMFFMVALQLLEGGMDFVVIAQSNVLRLYPCARAPCRLVKFVLIAALLRSGLIPYLWQTRYGIPVIESPSSKTYPLLMKFCLLKK